MPSRLLTAVLLLLALGAFATAAHASEEIIVLDNGAVFRGHVVQERDGEVELRLSGFGRDATVTVQKARIVSRFVPVRAESHKDHQDSAFSDWSAAAQSIDPSATPTEAPAERLPAEEPDVREEGFFRRLARVAKMSIPTSLGGRTSLGLLLFAALYALVALGGRLAEIELLGFFRASFLAIVLGGMLGADMLFYDTMLRADRAIWVLPVESVVWISCASAALRCGAARVILLFAFVLFSLAVMAFAAGAIVMAF